MQDLELDEVSRGYIEHVGANWETARKYYLNSLNKTEQQKFLEGHLIRADISPVNVADLACGAGTLSYHLSTLYTDAQFFLTDANDAVLHLARQLCTGSRFSIIKDNIILNSKLETNFFDVVFCWHTLFHFEEGQKIIQSAIRICKPGGRIYFMSLFNLDKEVDISAKLTDHTRDVSGKIVYNTFCKSTIKKWVGQEASRFEIFPFTPEIDFEFHGSGIGTFTVMSERGRLQISGGHLLNWGLLEIIK